MKAIVLGSGPAGLMAAHALVEEGVLPRILSLPQKSPLYGAQYLHKPIPGMTRSDPVRVQYELRGTPDSYLRKVYGQQWDGSVSPEDLEESHDGWDIRDTYDNLWDSYRSRIESVNVDPAGVAFLSKECDVLINTIPLQRLCAKGHQFRAQKVIAAGDAPDLGIDVGRIYGQQPDTVTCNGEEMPTWYRLSRIFDHTTIEWPASMRRVPVPTASEVLKPLDHQCDCWPDMIKVGRYGSWRKGVLSHDAYNRTKEVLTDGAAAQADRYNNPDVPTLW